MGLLMYRSQGDKKEPAAKYEKERSVRRKKGAFLRKDNVKEERMTWLIRCCRQIKQDKN
jgi:hypothetical protein